MPASRPIELADRLSSRSKIGRAVVALGTLITTSVVLPAGKTTDVVINVPSATTALPIFDRELSLSANSIGRDAGMLAYISVNGAALPTSGAFSAEIGRASCRERG